MTRDWDEEMDRRDAARREAAQERADEQADRDEWADMYEQAERLWRE